MIFRKRMQPGPEVFHLMFPEFYHKLLKDGDHAILRILWVFQVFEANTIYQFHIALVQFSQEVELSRPAVCFHQLGI